MLAPSLTFQRDGAQGAPTWESRNVTFFQDGQTALLRIVDSCAHKQTSLECLQSTDLLRAHAPPPCSYTGFQSVERLVEVAAQSRVNAEVSVPGSPITHPQKTAPSPSKMRP